MTTEQEQKEPKMPESSGSEKKKESIRLTNEQRALINRIQRETGQDFSEALRYVILRGAVVVLAELAEARSLDNKILVAEKLKRTLAEMGVKEAEIRALLGEE